jgi:PKD repeat protein
VQKAFNTWYSVHKNEIQRDQEKRERDERSRNNSSAKGKSPGEGPGEMEGAWMLYKRWEAFVGPRVFPSGDRMQMYNAMNTYAQSQMNLNGQKNQNNNNSSQKFSQNPNVQAGNWTLLGPTNSIPSGGGGAGRVNCVRVDPTNSNTLYVCSPGGGLWKSTNGGGSWTMWNTDALACIGASDIVIDPTNTQVMYLASGDGDAGDTYSLGVLKSTDGGVTWNATGLSYNVSQGFRIYKMLIDPTNTQILHAATNNGIYRTINGGTSWTQVQTGVFTDLEFMPGTPATVYAARYSSTTAGFYKSTNSGASYTNITSGLPASGALRYAIAVTPASTGTVYLVACNNSNYGFLGFYKSTNSGTSFTQVTVSSPSNLLGWASAGNDTGGQGWYTLSIAASPTNANEVVVGGVNIWRTTNGGTSWTLNAHWTGSGAPYVHADIHDLYWLSGSATTYWAGCDGGIFKTTNNGTAWSDLSNGGLDIGEMYRLSTSGTNVNLNMSGWQDNGTSKVSSGSWTEVLGGDGMECIIDYTNANIMYGEQYQGNINRSINGGGSWSTIATTSGTGVNAAGNWVTPYILHPTTPTTILVGKGGLYRSTNSGGTWSALGATTGGTGNIVQMAYAPSNPNYIYAVKQDAIFVSSNGGTSFTNVTGTVPTSNAFTYVTVSNTDPLKAWVTISGYNSANKVFMTSNGGTSWTNYSTGLPNLPVNCVVYQNSSPDGVYVGTDVGVYYRDNTLSSWAPFFTGLPNVKVDELEIQYTAGKIRAATYGRNMWESNLYSSGSAAPVANYTSNYQSGCPGIQIQFTDLSAFNPTSWSWNFPGGTPSTSTAQNPLITYNTVGTYQVSLWATNSNGTDSVLHSWVTISSTVPLPLVEGFQNAQFLPANWTRLDANNDNVYWQRSTTVGGYNASTACSYFDNYNLNVSGAHDEMWTPKYNLTTLSTCSLTFDVAYARYDATYSDSLEVLVSTNCGQTWTSVYLKGGTTLATAPDYTAAAFVPTAAQWRTENINLNAYVSSTTFMVSFRNRGRYGQMLYIDNINITGAPAAQAPVAAFTASATTFCKNSCINFTDNSTNNPTSWSWSFPGGTPTSSTIQNPTNICFNTAGTYTVSLTATNSNGSSTTTQVLTVNPLPTVTVTPNTSVCTGGNTSLTASGATTYSWSPATGLSATTGATVTSTPTATTTYTVTGTNANGCTNTAMVTVTVNPLPTVTHAPAAPSYCSGGSTSITASGANTYSWAPATGLSATTGATVTANPTVTTTYTITGTSAAGCTATNTVTVTVNPNPTVTVTPNQSICNGSNTSLTASGATTYSWAPATGLSATTGATVTASPTVTTTYTVTGTNASSCTGTATVTVTIKPLPTITHNPAAPSYCAGGSVNISASGGTSYTWAPATGLSSTTGANVTASPTVTTTYTITGTGANGCTNTNTVTVTVNPLPNITKNPAAPSYCTGGSISITASGANTYSWSPATGLSATTGATVTASPTVTTTYTITGTSAAGCTNTTTVTVTVNPLPTVTKNPAAPTICNGNSVSITASGASTYAWAPATGLSATTGATVSASPTVTTTYTITGTSGAGCTNTTTVTVTVNPSPTVTLSPSAPSYCAGGSVSVTASGANTYAWSPATGLSATTGATVTASPTATTTYTITGTGANGCTGTSTVTVTVNPLPTITANPSAPQMCSGGSATITASGANTYAWSPATGLSATTGATVTATPTATTTYTITGTDVTGCTNTTTVTVTINNNPVANAGSDVSICMGDNTTLNASGGGTYSWAPSTGLSSTTIANPVASPTATTSYTVTVTNGPGCTASDVVVVTVNPLPPAPTITQNSNVLTSSAATTYQWYLNSVIINGATSQTYTITQSGTYSVCITDVNGCSSCSSGFAAVYTGMSDDITNGTLSIFPNPNNGQFDISFDLNKKDNYVVEITDELGQLVYSEKLDSYAGHYSKHFDVKQYGAGMYMFTLKNSSNQSVKKVIVY